MATTNSNNAMAFTVPQTLISTDFRAPLCMAAQSLITAILINSTPKKSSLMRLASLPILISLMLQSWATAASFTGQSVLYSFWWVGPYANIFHCANNLLLHPLDSNDVQHEMQLQQRRRNIKSTSSPGFLQRIIWTLTLLFSFRGLGTTKQISYIPTPLPSPSRFKFLARQITLIALQYTIINLLASSPPPPSIVEGWAEGKEWLWIPSLNPHHQPVTKADLINRLVGCTMNWFVVGRCMNDIWYRIFSVLFVTSGISPPEKWPECFGTYADTYTLRGYFGKFWHQTLRWPFSGVAAFLSRRVLRFRPGGKADWYINLWVVFFLSGTLHAILPMAFGRVWQPAGCLLTFGLFLPLGIVFEDFVRGMWGKKGRPRWFERVVGHLWVVFYLALVTPVFNYPLQRIEGNPTYLVRPEWSLVHMLGKKV
ncbi:membrane bound O-acyl transferase family-domain-containing protein [Podospora australis]|uniref:Membrane bound O-acyl transferase family-domain-containing protein n=1 Tax=Podospora australis TaxID=1536484 RepID=A0AAN6WME9_9PEZI|nr:membrane bound O-acyl transferase family-domain-containing protein [Podospora australis]